ncbi:hypothetical protein JR316_0001920 [Psilocybe cubensis]|uniref:Uncharacterized protein n=2 Tax=Psilocybe cubensis TaxID=181762 RepID=A0ACB8HAR6_PSICU|nr:hypothetical protein JR316_0001920 [Psilocybe cubensis]KAH9485016.1 hypothetical protein JR316_0001920 [Psilocybe cubensis]
MMLRKTSIFMTVAILGTSAVSAGSVLDFLSSSCKNTLQTLLSSPSAGCLNLGTLTLNALAGNKTIPEVANSWLTGLCASGSCTNSSLSDVVSNITTGCSEDLNKYGASSAGFTPDVIQGLVLQYYPTVRQIACLKDDNANELCVPESLFALQSIVGTINKGDLDLPTLLGKVKTLADSDYKNIACTGCIKQAYIIAAKVFPNANLLNLAQTPITDTCGASFVDGQDVPGISETAQSGEFVATKPNSSGALSFKGTGMTGPVFAGLSAALAFLL